MDMPSRPVSPAAESVQPTVEPTPPVLPTTTTTLPEPPILSPMVDNLSTARPGCPAFLGVLEPLAGRYQFPLSDPSSTAMWTHCRWSEQLKLTPFAPADELQLEAWAEANSRAVSAAAPMVRTFLSVLGNLADPSYACHFSTVSAQSRLLTFEDVIDGLALSIFKTSGAAGLLELSFFSPPRAATVMAAQGALLERVRAYSYICARRGRINFLTAPFLSDCLLRSVPMVVQHRVCDFHDNFLNFATTLDLCFDSENKLTSRNGGVLPEPTTPLTYAAVVLPPKLDCHGCGGKHFRKNCPHRETRCSKCHYQGHTTDYCRSHVVLDSAGNKRLTIRAQPSKVAAEYHLDDTRQKQLLNAKNVIQTMSATELKRSEANKARLKAKRALSQPPTKKARKENPPQAEVPSQEITAQMALVSDDEEDDGDICYSSAVPDELPTSRRVPQIDVKLNGKPIRVVIDSGTECNIISAHTASSLHIPTDPNVPPVPVRGIGGISEYMFLTHPTSLQVSSGPSIPVRFRVCNVRRPTLLNFETIIRLHALIDGPNRLLLMPTENIPISYITDTISQTSNSTDTELLDYIETTTCKIVESLEITDDSKSLLLLLLQQYSDIWARPKAGLCNTLKVNFVVKGKPKRFNPRPLSEKLLKEAHKQVDDLLASGVIVADEQSAWASPIVMVPKKAIDGEVRWRMAIDYRYVNRLLQDDNYPLPVIHDLYTQLYNRKYFTCIDLNWGFWNVRLDEECQKYTAFTVPHKGIFLWKVLPFGMKTSPTEFQHAVEKALRPLLDTGNVKVYIDDIIIATKDQTEHFEMLERVFEALRTSKLFINIKKTQFIQTTVNYLGSVLSQNSISPDPKKIQGITNTVPPKDKAQLRSFLGATGYLRQFIPNFAEIVRPLTDLTKKGKLYEWEAIQQTAFDEIKQQIAEAVALSLPQPNTPFTIYTDASNIGVGAILTQVLSNGIVNYIHFASKSFNETQQRWGVGEREAFAVVWACETFERYIKGIFTTVYTDHKNLNWMSSSINSKILRWAIRLQDFNIEIKYIAGEENSIADWLSRSQTTDEVLEDHMMTPIAFNSLQSYEPTGLPSLLDITEAARAETGDHVKQIVWHGDTPRWHRTNKLYVPEKYRSLILWWFHASTFGGHMGIGRTRRRLQKYFSWPKMHEDVEKYISSCVLCRCLRSSPPTTKGKKGALDQITSIRSRIS